MKVALTSDQQAFVKLAVEDGRVRSEEEAVQQALALWEERERARLNFIATLDQAEASLARGEGRILKDDEDLRRYAAELKERGRTRLAS